MNKNRYVHWTKELLNLVRTEYATADTEELASRIGCTVSALQAKAQILGVTKIPEPWRLNRCAPKYLKDGQRREIATGIIIQSGHVTTHISRCSALLEEE